MLVLSKIKNRDISCTNCLKLLTANIAVPVLIFCSRFPVRRTKWQPELRYVWAALRVAFNKVEASLVWDYTEIMRKGFIIFRLQEWGSALCWNLLFPVCFPPFLVFCSSSLFSPLSRPLFLPFLLIVREACNYCVPMTLPRIFQPPFFIHGTILDEYNLDISHTIEISASKYSLGCWPPEHSHLSTFHPVQNWHDFLANHTTQLLNAYLTRFKYTYLFIGSMERDHTVRVVDGIHIWPWYYHVLTVGGESCKSWPPSSFLH